MKHLCEVYRLGTVPYTQAWELQGRLADGIASGERPATLLLLEHPHTYTFGRRGQAENLLWNQEELARRGVEVHWVDRGGDVTYHGPGQLVGYPLLPLAPARALIDGKTEANERIPQADYVGYVRRLEQVLIDALARVGVASGRVEGLTGVWVGLEDPSSPPAKIAAIGVKVDARGVTRHGFALNVHPDMSYWQGIIGCGIKNYSIASLKDCLPSIPSMWVVMDAVVDSFGETFNYQMVEPDNLAKI